MSVSAIPLEELAPFFAGRPHLSELWQLISEGRTDLSPAQQVELILAEMRVFEMRGDRGEGPTYMVHPDETLSYAIAFENLPNATAPAQVVIISDTIATTKLDLSTLRLGAVIFSNTLAISGPGVLPFVKDIDLRPQHNLTVRIEADLASGHTLVWRLTSLDPGTDEISVDALNGFLRPNQNGSEGQGYVFFSIRPKAGLPMRTLISNTATIVFDNNASMQTPTWTNEIWHTETYLPLIRR